MPRPTPFFLRNDSLRRLRSSMTSCMLISFTSSGWRPCVEPRPCARQSFCGAGSCAPALRAPSACTISIAPVLPRARGRFRLRLLLAHSCTAARRRVNAAASTRWNQIQVHVVLLRQSSRGKGSQLLYSRKQRQPLRQPAPCFAATGVLPTAFIIDHSQFRLPLHILPRLLGDA